MSDLPDAGAVAPVADQPAPEPTPAAVGARVPATIPQPIGPPPGPPSRVTMEHLLALPDSERRTNWINALVEAEIARQTYAYDRSIAREYALSGKLDDLKGATAEQAIATAMVKIQLGRSWGFSAADSIQSIFFTNGRPAIEQSLVASKLVQGGFAWDVEFSWGEGTDPVTKQKSRRCTGCTLYLKRLNPTTRQYEPMLDRKGNQVEQSFGDNEANSAQIWEKGKQIPLSAKWNYQSWGQDMYYWRAISRVKKFYAPHILRGAVSRDEALEMMPGDAPPELHGDLPAPDPEVLVMEDVAEVAPEPKPKNFKDRIMSQPSFLPETE